MNTMSYKIYRHGGNRIIPSENATPKCYVDAPMALVLVISSWVTVTPVTLRRQGALWEMRYSKRMRWYGCIMVTGLVLTLISGVILDILTPAEQSMRAGSLVNLLVWACDVITTITITVLGIYTSPARIQQIFIFTNSVEKINFEMKHFLKPKRVKKEIMLCILVMIYIASLFVLDYYYHYWKALKDNNGRLVSTMYILFYFIYFGEIVLELEFALLMVSLDSSLDAVNNALQKELEFIRLQSKIFHEKSVNSLNRTVDLLEFSQTEKPPPFFKSCDSIRYLSRHHSLLSELICGLERSHGPILAVLVFSYLLHLIETPYYLIDNVMNDMEIHYVIMQTFWCIFHLINMCTVIDPCHKIMEQMKRTRAILNQLYRLVSSRSEPLYQQLQLYSDQLQVSSQEITPLGLFTLHRPLIVTIIGGVATYLVIVIQFQTLTI